jgi:hypothetical protein
MALATYSITLVGNREYPRRNGEAERPGSLEVDDELELGGLLHWQIGRPGTFQYLVNITSSTPIQVGIFRPVGLPSFAGGGMREIMSSGKPAPTRPVPGNISAGHCHGRNASPTAPRITYTRELPLGG